MLLCELAFKDLFLLGAAVCDEHEKEEEDAPVGDLVEALNVLSEALALAIQALVGQRDVAHVRHVPTRQQHQQYPQEFLHASILGAPTAGTQLNGCSA